MSEEYAYGMWIVAAFNVGLFLFFILSFIKPKKNIEWRNMGVVTAFLVALFAEMYGFPLTIYLLTGWLGDAYPVLQPFNHKYGHLWVVFFGGSTLVWFFVMGLSLFFMLIGYSLMSKGWRHIHGAREELVIDGLYAYVRHPQYTGLFMLIIGFLIQWPTILTVIMAPILIYAYIHLSRSEESVVMKNFGQTYIQYAKSTLMFIPPLSQWKSFLSVNSNDGH